MHTFYIMWPVKCSLYFTGGPFFFFLNTQTVIYFFPLPNYKREVDLGRGYRRENSRLECAPLFRATAVLIAKRGCNGFCPSTLVWCWFVLFLLKSAFLLPWKLTLCPDHWSVQLRAECCRHFSLQSLHDLPRACSIEAATFFWSFTSIWALGLSFSGPSPP